MQNFNPRSPRGGATQKGQNNGKNDNISIHAPHEGERRRGQTICRRQTCYFNPRSPRGGATSGDWITLELPQGISIHAPHEGERRPYRARHQGDKDFNPRSPRGGATAEKCICIQHFREFAEYYPLRHGDARCIAPQDCIIQAFFGAKKRCFYVRLCFALKNKGARG